MSITLNGTEGVTLDNGSADGAQVTLKSSGYSDWNLDNYSGRFRAYYNATEYFTITNTGNVGIGTNSPQRTLDVNGNMRLGSANGRFIEILNATSQASYISQESLAELRINQGTLNSDSKVTFLTQGSERMRIDSNGDTYINTTSQATNYGARMNLWGNYTAQWGLSMNSTSSTGTQYYIAFIRNNSGSAAGTISSTATNSTTYATTSDYRLKENVTPMMGALDKVALLNPVTYTWKEDGSSSQGFIAHELQAVVPECVVGEKDEIREDGTPVYQGVDTSFLVATLTAAIKEQQELIKALTSRIETLEAK